MRFAHHGWLTPAALGARRRSAKNGDIRDAQTHAHKSGGCQPAVGSRDAPATASVFVRTGRSRRTRTAGLRQPLLVHDIAFHRKIAPFAVHKRTCTRAAGVSPPWWVIETLCGENRVMFGDQRMHDQERRASARRGYRNAIATGNGIAGSDDGRYQERRASARRGCGKHDCADTRAFVLQTADGLCADRRCIHGNGYHGGAYAPRSCIATRTSAGIKNDFCDAQTHMHKSGGRQPAVAC